MSTVYIVPCSQQKNPGLARMEMPACLAYTGPAFRIARRKLEEANAKWFILSAKYGFITPFTLIESYDQLIETDPEALNRWDNVFDHLNAEQAGALICAQPLIS